MLCHIIIIKIYLETSWCFCDVGWILKTQHVKFFQSVYSRATVIFMTWLRFLDASKWFFTKWWSACVCVCVSECVDPQFIFQVQHQSGRICNKTFNGNPGLMITTILSLKFILEACMVIKSVLSTLECRY